MWLMFAFGSAIFAGLTAILSKIGISNSDSNVATAIRTIVVVPIDKLSLLVTVAFSSIILKERVNRRSLAGLELFTLGTLSLLIH